MSRIYLQLNGTHIAIECPEILKSVIATFWPKITTNHAPDTPVTEIRIDEEDPKSWIISGGTLEPTDPVRQADLIVKLTERVQSIVLSESTGIAINAGAVSWDQKLILVVGATGAGKTFLVSWLVEKGLALIADNNLFFSPEENTIAGLGGPISVQADARSQLVEKLKDFRDCLKLKGTDQDIILSNPEWVLPNSEQRPAFLIFIDHDLGEEFSVSPMAEDDIRAKISNSHPTLSSDELLTLQTFLEDIPAISLSYSDFEEIENVVDQLCFYVLSVMPDAEVFHDYVRRMRGSSSAQKKVHEIPERTNRTLSPRLTIGMATYDDYDGVYFSIQAIRMYHPDILDNVEFLVLDNNPDGACSGALKRLENHIENYRYVPATGIRGTAVRDYIFREALGEYVLSMDCHVFFAPGSLQRLLQFYEQNPDTNDLLQGPLLYDGLKTVATHFDPKWRDGMYGFWSPVEKDFDKEADPFEIPCQGLGVFSCRKVSWPGFNPSFHGFGGEEGYIHQKFRNHGHKTLCLPFLQWMHRFERPFGPAYRNVWEDRIRNYLIGWEEVGLPVDEMREHFSEFLNKNIIEKVFRKVEREKSKPIIGQAQFPSRKPS